VDSISVMEVIRFIHLSRGGIIIGECEFEPLGETFEGGRKCICERVVWNGQGDT
jgi:hypothetical protein